MVQNKKSRICPVISDGNREEHCKEHDCQWWTQAYTTENNITWDCAEVIKAHLNAEGQFVV